MFADCIPGEQGAVMTRVRFAVALSGGRPESHTRKGIRSTLPTGKLVLRRQFCSPTLPNSCPALSTQYMHVSKRYLELS